MSKPLSFFRTVLRLVLIVLAGLFALLFLLVLSASGSGFLDAVSHLVAGFGFFLIGKLPLISSDAGTWGPGVAAWVLALALGHLLLRKRALARGHYWRVTTTICLGLLLPVLFATAFIVPGILQQVDGLGKVRWFEGSGSSYRAEAIMELRNLAQACLLFANQADDGKFPDSVDDLVQKDWLSKRPLDLSGDRNIPPEYLIYLGAGYTRDTAGDAPLAISPRYEVHGSWQRTVVTIDGTMTSIQDDEVDAWIDRVVPR